jgi:hypothetical protein
MCGLDWRVCMETEVMKAIPRSAVIKRIVLYVGIGVLLAWFGHSFLRPAVIRYLTVGSEEEFIRRSQLLAIGFSVCELPMALYLAVLAMRIIRSRQSPYPGAKVWRDTPIVHGREALVRGWGAAAGAACVLGTAIFVAYLPHRMADIWRVQPHSSVLSPKSSGPPLN